MQVVFQQPVVSIKPLISNLIGKLLKVKKVPKRMGNQKFDFLRILAFWLTKRGHMRQCSRN